MEEQSDDLEVRRTVLGEHDELRRRLDEIDRGLARVATAGDPALVEAHQNFQAMNAFFLGHLEHEEGLLAPILAGLEAWGPVRLEQLLAEHAAQRIEIAQLAALGPTRDWADRMKQFARSLRADMAGEEYDLIHPNVVPRRPVS